MGTDTSVLAWLAPLMAITLISDWLSGLAIWFKTLRQYRFVKAIKSANVRVRGAPGRWQLGFYQKPKYLQGLDL